MSCDYAVWKTPELLTSSEAGRLYGRLCEGDLGGVTPDVRIARFYEELTSIHPEIDDVSEDQLDNKDLCPWSIAFDRSEGHIIMCCVWSKADYVGGLIRDLATKHELDMYDPQSDRLHTFGKQIEAKPWWKLW